MPLSEYSFIKWENRSILSKFMSDINYSVIMSDHIKSFDCIRQDISRESSAGKRSSCNIIPYFSRILRKMSQNVSSDAFVIGALSLIPVTSRVVVDHFYRGMNRELVIFALFVKNVGYNITDASASPSCL